MEIVLFSIGILELLVLSLCAWVCSVGMEEKRTWIKMLLVDWIKFKQRN